MSDEPRTLEAYCRDKGVEAQVGPGLEGQTVDAGDPRYRLVEELGRGSFGRVMLAVDRDLRRTVALKLLNADEASPEEVQLFLEEAVITGGLEHPNIVPAYELGYTEALGLYYTMKRLRGRSLRSLLDAQESLSIFRRLVLFSDICRAIAYAHERRVIHTDLKPENVLVDDRGEVVVADWGVAQVLGEAGQRQARARMDVGTPQYMSPEQANDAELDERTDVWSLGVILYELLSGRTPFAGSDADAVRDAVLCDPVPPLVEVPAPLGALVMGALQKRLESRTPSVEMMLDGLTQYLDGERERLRRMEEVRGAIVRAESILAELSEDEVDRRRRFDTYQRAHRALVAALPFRREAPEAGRLAGRLYWEIFSRVHPGAGPVDEALALDAMELLTTLSQAALPEVVAAGRHVADVKDGGKDVWLEVVRSFAQGDALTPVLPQGMARIAERIELLRGIELFASLAPPELLPVADACRDVMFADGAVLFEQGDAGAALFMVEEGEVEIILDGVVVNVIGGGAVFGEISVLAEGPRTAGARAKGTLRCLMLEADRFRSIVATQGEIGLGVIDVLVSRLEVATAREAALRAERTL